MQGKANGSSSQLASFLGTLDTCHLFKGIRRERRGGRNGSTGLLPPGIHTKGSPGHLPSSGADWSSWCCTPREPRTLPDAATPSRLQHLGFGCQTDNCCYTLFPGGDKFVRYPAEGEGESLRKKSSQFFHVGKDEGRARAWPTRWELSNGSLLASVHSRICCLHLVVRTLP